MEMRKLLLLALLLYDIVAGIKVNNVEDTDYDDSVNRKTDDSRRHSVSEDRRTWRKQTLTRGDENPEESNRNLNRLGHGHGRKLEDDKLEHVAPLRNRKRRYNEVDDSEAYLDNDANSPRKLPKNSGEKYVDKKTLLSMSCNREHERYEPCFAGCASISCDNPRDRMRACYPFCEPGCVCVPPRVRDDRTHKCVMPEECTKGLKGIPDLGMNDEIRARKK